MRRSVGTTCFSQPIGPGVLVGAGAVILQGLRVAANMTVVASACVTRDNATGLVATGVPAR